MRADERASVATEYALLVAVVGITAFLGVLAFSDAVQALWSDLVERAVAALLGS